MADSQAVVTSCPICGGQKTVPHCDKPAHGDVWHIRRCRACGHGFVANPPTLQRLNEIQSALEAHERSGDGGGGDDGDGAKLTPPRAEGENLVFARRIASLTTARGKTLDVGCGDGSATLALSHQGFRPHLLIDFDPRAAGAVEHIPNSRFERIAFEQLTTDAHGPFDVIVMSHVLEHSLHPLDWLTHARQLLSPQGILGIGLPNFGGVYRFLGERDPFLIPPVHLQFFTPSSMRRALERSGMDVIRMESRSGITLTPVRGALALPHQLARRAWNAGAALLNRTTRGIVLWAFARRA
jgi:SAM-dependent methyltransferase